jgi:hypothetical protein
MFAFLRRLTTLVQITALVLAGLTCGTVARD